MTGMTRTSRSGALSGIHGCMSKLARNLGNPVLTSVRGVGANPTPPPILTDRSPSTPLHFSQQTS